MKKIFDRFTVKKRYFIVREGNMIEAMNMIKNATSNGYYTGSMSVGNCRWADESDLWFIHMYLTNKQWRILLGLCEANKYQLVIKNNPYDMYFTKIEESK